MPSLPTNPTMHAQEKMTCSAWLSNLLDGNYKAAPTAHMLSASQNELRVMMHGETGKLLELRRELEKEMERISEDFISTHYKEIHKNLSNITGLRIDYQNEVKDFMNMFTEVLDDTSVLDEWTNVVGDIGKVVKEFRVKVRLLANQLDAKPPVPPRPIPDVKPVLSVKERKEMNRWPGFGTC